MKQATLGPLGPVSRLTLGGGGIGQIWGEVSREEAEATIAAAIDGGITVLDAAPGYRNCETFIGEVFNGRLPAGVKVTTKHALGTVPPGEAADRLTASLDASLAAMRLPRVDLFFLHTQHRARRFRLRPRRRAPDAGGDHLDPVCGRGGPGDGAAKGRRPHRRLGDHRHRRAGRDPGGAGARPEAGRGPGHRQFDGQPRRAQPLWNAAPGRARSSPPPRPPALASWASAPRRPAP
ncbi:MAG: aldo/keto reductase [Caulobacteraceae bacterium]